MNKFGYYALPFGLASALLQGCLEAPNPVEERQEAIAASYLAPGQDLIITAVTVTSVSPTTIYYTYTIKNAGTEAVANPSNVILQSMYSANSVFGDAGDVYASSTRLGVSSSLAAGASLTGTFHSPSPAPAGKPFLMFKIDFDNILAEKNENNNTYALLAAPDLQFTSFTITSRTSTRVNYAYTIRNNGTIAIPSLYDVVIQNFYSANTVYDDAGDVAAGGSKLLVSQSLAAGASYSGTYYSSGAVTSGRPYLTTKIDHLGSVTEANENNNTVARLIP